MSILSAFNKQLIEFADDLILLYPDDIDFKTFKTHIQLMQKVNARKMLNLFKEYCIPYTNEILNKNEDFFLDNNYNQDHHNDNLIIIKKIKNCWSNINNSNRAIIWKYFEILITLSSKS